LRNLTLRRHEEELKQLDADESELETLERLLAVVTTKYLDRGRTPSPAVAPAEESPVPAAQAEEPPGPEAQSNAAAPQMQIEQSVSPNFGIPLRRFMRR